MTVVKFCLAVLHSAHNSMICTGGGLSILMINSVTSFGFSFFFYCFGRCISEHERGAEKVDKRRLNYGLTAKREDDEGIRDSVFCAPDSKEKQRLDGDIKCWGYPLISLAELISARPRELWFATRRSVSFATCFSAAEYNSDWRATSLKCQARFWLNLLTCQERWKI